MIEQNPTIKLTQEFKDWLQSQGTKGESFQDIIIRLLKLEKQEPVLKGGE